MKTKGIVIAAIALLVSVGAASAQTLAELAKKEKERREKIQAESKTITNTDATKYQSGSVTTANIPAPQAEKADSEKPGEPVESDEPVDFQGRPESFWRQTFTDARQQITELENESNVLILKLNDLQNRFYREDDGFRQQQIQREIQKTFFLQDQNREALSKAREQLTDLEKEARKSGALPGWIEAPRKP